MGPFGKLGNLWFEHYIVQFVARRRVSEGLKASPLSNSLTVKIVDPPHGLNVTYCPKIPRRDFDRIPFYPYHLVGSSRLSPNPKFLPISFRNSFDGFR
jgi:hypothetical protein